jgi:hypothetical protein
MSDLIPTGPAQPVPAATRVAMADDAPSIEELFLFAREAELRVQSLRMTIEERLVTARGPERIVHEIQLRHPGHTRVTTRRSQEPLSRDYDTWVSDGETITAYAAVNRLASVRKHRRSVVGSDDPGLPPFARQYQPLTKLPAGSLADAFIHPHGLFRNVLVSGPLAIVGVREVAGREAIVVRAQHPRSAKVLVDRPDRSIEVGIGRDSGFVLLLTEHIGDAVTRHAEVTTLQIDPVIHDSAFELRLPVDVRKVY